MDNNNGCVGCKWYRKERHRDFCVWKIWQDKGVLPEDCLRIGDCKEYEEEDSQNTVNKNKEIKTQ